MSPVEGGSSFRLRLYMNPNSHFIGRAKVFQRIASLLWVLVIAVAIAFCYFASSFCITLLLATFLAILVDPIVTLLEQYHVPRAVSAALVISVGMISLGFLAYGSYNRISCFVEAAPSFADRMRDVLGPVNQKIAQVEETAGRINPEPPAKKITEVRVRQAPTWPSYLIRGFGSVSSAVVILGVVPFLMFFLLIRKDKWYENLSQLLGPDNDPSAFSESLTELVRRFAIGNLAVGILMAGVTTGMLFALKIQGAIVVGAVSGFLNLIPFLGSVVAALVPMAAALLQSASLSTLLIIPTGILALHILASNFLIPRVIGARMNVGPVAATAGILFWGWLWGIVGVLLAIPLTGVVKLITDCHPSLRQVSSLLADTCLPDCRHLTNAAAVDSDRVAAATSLPHSESVTSVIAD